MAIYTCEVAARKEKKLAREKGKNVLFAEIVADVSSIDRERDLANVRKPKRTEKGREECKDLGCSPCRRPRAIDSRASRPLRGRGTRERGTREGIPAGEGEESGNEHGGRARRARV